MAIFPSQRLMLAYPLGDRRQIRRRQRLQHVIIRAGAQSLQNQFRLPVSSHQDHIAAPPVRQRLQPSRHFHAAQPRHMNIRQYQGEIRLLPFSQCFLRFCALDYFMPQILKKLRRCMAAVLIVIKQQYPHDSSSCLRTTFAV